MKTMTILILGTVVAMAAASASALAATSHAQHTHEAALSLFGAPLKGAKRADLEAAFAHSALKPTRVDDHYIGDIYDASGVLDGASTFIVEYTDDPAQVFAEAEYKFPAFMDISMVQKVERMVADKYGAPSYRSGDIDLGAVDYRWDLPDGMRIEVSRGWPVTDVYLDFIDIAAHARLDRELKADAAARLRKKAQAQSTAF